MQTYNICVNNMKQIIILNHLLSITLSSLPILLYVKVKHEPIFHFVISLTQFNLLQTFNPLYSFKFVDTYIFFKIPLYL